MGKIAYLGRCMKGQFERARFACPNCGSTASAIIARKFIIASLRRCASCELQFRTPTDDPTHNLTYYELEYSQGFTTDLPSDHSLAALLANNFEGEKSWTYYNDVL